MIKIIKIRELLNFFADMCILSITIYTFYKTFISRSIKFRYLYKSMSVNKEKCFSVVLENKTLSPMIIDKINLIIDEKYKVELKKFENPLIIDPFKVVKVNSNRYSYTNPEIPLFNKMNSILEIKFLGSKNKYITMNNKRIKNKKELENMLENVTKITNTFNGKVVPENTKYILMLKELATNISETIFIMNSGYITEEIFGFNNFTEEMIENKDILTEFLDDKCKEFGYKYYLIENDLMDF